MNHRCKRGSESKSYSSKDIHDKIDPNELCGLEGRFSQTNSSNDKCENASKIASHLELEEFLDIRVNVPTPHDTTDHRYEFICSQNKRGSSS